MFTDSLKRTRREGIILISACVLALPALTFAFRPLVVPILCVDPSTGLFKTGANRMFLANDGGNELKNGNPFISDPGNDIWGLVEIDGVAKRFMGANTHGAAKLSQKSMKVNPTQSIWVMQDSSIQLTVTFTAPKLLDELDAVARPINYVTFDAAAIDGKNHAVKATLYTSGGVNGGWQVGGSGLRQQTFDFGSIGATPVRRFVSLGHVENESISWLGTALRPWWNRSGNKTFAQVFADANAEHDRLFAKCEAFDRQVIADAMAAGDTIYADLLSQCYRQCLKMNKLVAYNDTTPFFCSLEGYSGRLVNTIDVIHPQAPLFLYASPASLKTFLETIFILYESGRCGQSDPPPHDIGPWPSVNGCNLGYWVEEAGNMMLLSAAVCHLEKSGAYAQKHWLMLSRWVDWLRRNGLDPVSQNSTDDFSGSYPHSCLLSIKACLGIGCYVKMATMAGRADSAAKYQAILDTATAGVIRRGYENGHFKKANDLPGTWSMKYNLAWQRALGLKVFGDSILQNEMKQYRNNIKKYGVPLLSTETYTKSDWILFAASITGNRDDFMALAKTEWTFLNECTNFNVGIPDWHGTVEQYGGNFEWRGVVGGYFFELMARKCLGSTAARPVPAKSGPAERHMQFPRKGAQIDMRGLDKGGAIAIADMFGRVVKQVCWNGTTGRPGLVCLPNGWYTAIFKSDPGRSQSRVFCVAK